MKIIRRLADFPEALQGCAVTIGNFDGVHRGHALLVDQLKSQARPVDVPTVVFTFDPHPVQILRPQQTPPPLTWVDRKAELLAELGVDAVVAYPTDLALLGLSDREFFEQIVVGALGATAMAEGPNFCFGRGRTGDTDRLTELCREHQIQLTIADPEIDGQQLISSSRIRALIGDGDVGAAAQMLTQPYRIRGTVSHGAARGGQIGFPTANLSGVDTLIPAIGVYAGRSYIDGQPHWSAIHIGPNPTFDDSQRKIESHLLDFDRSIYGAEIELDFVSRLRDIRRFDSTTELTQQLESDVAATRAVAERLPKNGR